MQDDRDLPLLRLSSGRVSWKIGMRGTLFPFALPRSLAFIGLVLLLLPAAARAVYPGYLEIDYTLQGDFYMEGEIPDPGGYLSFTTHQWNGTLTVRFDIDASGNILPGGHVEVVDWMLSYEHEEVWFVPPFGYVARVDGYCYDAPDARWDGVPDSALTPGFWQGELVEFPSPPPWSRYTAEETHTLEQLSFGHVYGEWLTTDPGSVTCALMPPLLHPYIQRLTFDSPGSGSAGFENVTVEVQLDPVPPTGVLPQFPGEEVPGSRRLVFVDSGPEIAELPIFSPLGLLLLPCVLFATGRCYTRTGR